MEQVTCHRQQLRR